MLIKAMTRVPRLLLAGVLVVLAALAPAASAWAAPLGQETPTGNLTFLFAAYAVVFVALAAYIFFLSRRQRELDQEVKALRRELEERERAARQGRGAGGGEGPGGAQG